jgi:hypothetical protein
VTRQAAVLIVDGMPMDRAIGMDVGEDMPFGFATGMAVAGAVMLVTLLGCGRVCRHYQRPLKGKRHCRRHHDGDSEPAKRRWQTRTQNSLGSDSLASAHPPSLYKLFEFVDSCLT